MKQLRILHIISLIRDAHQDMEHIFLNGSCFQLFTILHAIFPEAIAYYDGDHIITRIDKYYYDIRGSVNGKGYLPYTKYHSKEILSKLFKTVL